MKVVENAIRQDVIVSEILSASKTPTEIVSMPKVTSDNWRQLLDEHKISFTKVYKELPSCIDIINKDGSASRFATFGNFTTVIGKGKSKKTFLLALIMAFVLKGEVDNQKFRIHFPDDKNFFLWFDTEQSEFDVSCVAQRTLRVAELTNPPNFEMFNLRAFSPGDRLTLIDKKIRSTPNLGLVVIDGVRDLAIDPILNAEDSERIVTKLLQWTMELHIHIIVVLHQNKNNEHARGIIGTELINKGETVISVEKEEHASIVKPEFCRGREFQPFAFAVDDRGLPYLLEDYNSKSLDTEKKKLTAYDVSKDTHFQVLRTVFADGLPKKYKELESALKVIYQGNAVKLTNQQVVDFISYFKMNQFITDTGGKGRMGNQYTLNKSLCAI